MYFPSLVGTGTGWGAEGPLRVRVVRGVSVRGVRAWAWRVGRGRMHVLLHVPKLRLRLESPEGQAS